MAEHEMLLATRTETVDALSHFDLDRLECLRLQIREPARSEVRFSGETASQIFQSKRLLAGFLRSCEANLVTPKKTAPHREEKQRWAQ